MHSGRTPPPTMEWQRRPLPDKAVLATRQFRSSQNAYGDSRGRLQNVPGPLSKDEQAACNGYSEARPADNGRLCAPSPGHAPQTIALVLPRQCQALAGIPAVFEENKSFGPVRNE